MQEKIEKLKIGKYKFLLLILLVIISFFIGRFSVNQDKPPKSGIQERGMQSDQKGRNNFNGMIRGVIDSLDGKNLVIKGQDGSSKIILLSSSTTVSKSVVASSSDLINGQNVMVRGKSNTDGSVIAESIQVFTDQDFGFRSR